MYRYHSQLLEQVRTSTPLYKWRKKRRRRRLRNLKTKGTSSLNIGCIFCQYFYYSWWVWADNNLILSHNLWFMYEFQFHFACLLGFVLVLPNWFIGPVKLYLLMMNFRKIECISISEKIYSWWTLFLFWEWTVCILRFYVVFDFCSDCVRNYRLSLKTCNACLWGGGLGFLIFSLDWVAISRDITKYGTFCTPWKLDKCSPHEKDVQPSKNQYHKTANFNIKQLLSYKLSCGWKAEPSKAGPVLYWCMTEVQASKICRENEWSLKEELYW